jgi:CAI-1 autoinducer synthase
MTTAINFERFATQPAARRMPEFVTRRMDEHYVDRVQKLLGGEHMHVWTPPQAGAVMLAGNDYLCIANEPALIEAQVRTLQGTQGQMLMSSVFLQEGSFQHRLEAKLAAFMGAEDGVLAQSGWAANVGLLQSIAEPGIPVYLDMQAHASLWEGVQSAQALPVPFLHNSTAHLERLLEKHGGGVIVIDALYSTNGSVAPLLEFVELAERQHPDRRRIAFAGHPRSARRRPGGRAWADRARAFPYGIDGQGLRRPRRVHHLFEPIQGIFLVRIQTGHLQFLSVEP